MTKLYRELITSRYVPWRLRNALTLWVEHRCRERKPNLYRLIHLGERTNRVEALTRGPKHHFFGYYDKSPWNASQTLMLAHEADFNDRPPESDDACRIGIVHLSDKRFEPLGESRAWNWQQGTMLAWYPADPQHTFVHNDRERGAAIGIVRDTSGRVLQRYERPIYALSPDGRLAWSLNFARLARHRPGYGYAGVIDPHGGDPTPADDGLHVIELDSGRCALIVSLQELSRRATKPVMQGQFHWLNHVQPSPQGFRIAFFHLWREGTSDWGARLYTCKPDGAELSCALDTGRISHYDWLDEDHILVWARRIEGGEHFLLVDVRDGSYRVFGDGVLTEDGHATFSPDRRWVLNDTYPDRHDMRNLMLVSWPKGQRIDIARTYSPKSRWWGEIRCDLHPRWSRDGRQVCIDSVHDGTRQIYVADLSRWIT